jgi:hypothetical protein
MAQLSQLAKKFTEETVHHLAVRNHVRCLCLHHLLRCPKCRRLSARELTGERREPRYDFKQAPHLARDRGLLGQGMDDLDRMMKEGPPPLYDEEYKCKYCRHAEWRGYREGGGGG